MIILRKLLLKYLVVFTAVFVVNPGFSQTQFVENKGQWDNRVNFRNDFNGGAFFLRNQGFTVLLEDQNDLQALSEMMHRHGPFKGKPVTLHSHAYKVDFLGAAASVKANPEKILPTYNNYFVGKDQSKWAGDCKIYQAVTYQDVYPKIDVRYYSDAGNLKYDLIVHPGGDINAIAMRYDGIDKLQLKNKELVIGTSVGSVTELYPYSYQVQEGKKETLSCRYAVKDNVVRFKVGEYSPDATIVIDPTLIFSTFTGSSEDNWGYTATPGPGGTFFAGGIAFRGGFPVSPGAFQTVFLGGPDEDKFHGYDIAIMKFSADGSKRIYATYLGGTGNEQPHSMICDAQGNLFVSGRTNSTDYPLKPAGNFIHPTESSAGYDIVITEFNASGSNIIGSVKIGGSADDGVNIRSKYANPGGDDATRRNYGDDARSEVILDGAGNVYLASCTQSTDFPVTKDTTYPQPAFGGGRQDGVILKFTPNLNNLIFAKYFGGSGDDACFSLSLNPVNGNLYVAGATTSDLIGLPGDKSNTIGSIYQGGKTDGFVTEIKPDGSAIIKTTYIGTTGNDMVYGIQMDKFGFPYIMGTTTGTWPVISANFSNPGGKQFICKLKPDLSAYVYSTIFGPNSQYPCLSPVAFLVDRCQNVYVSGWGGGINIDDGYSSSGTLGLPEVNQLPGLPAPDGADFYFFVLERNAKSQFFGTHFGQYGGLGDHVDGGTSRYDANGIIYQAICANCGGPLSANFPTTAGVWAMTNGSRNCNEAAVKIEMDFAGVGASVKATINGVIDTIGCVPVTIHFTDTLAKGKLYIWDYGDPSSVKRDTTYAPNNSTTHTYNFVGRYKVMLISLDSSTCNISDTAYVTVRVGNNEVIPDFNFVKLDSCNSLRYRFNNLTTAVLPNFSGNTFHWDFGDGTELRTGFAPVIHSFPSVGTYKVTLTVDDTLFCNIPADTIKTLRISPNIRALFSTPANGCIPYNAVFKNNSSGGTDFIWEFGDGNFSNLFEPVHLYSVPGTYRVRLIARDTNTCNKVDTSEYFSITVVIGPSASFTWTPNPPIVNTITHFINQSGRANHYLWDFGDGESSSEVNPIHQYNSTGTFKAILYAYNVSNCVDSFPRDIPILIDPLLDVPNAFTPGRFGINGVISVEGFGIGKMSWKIYNRWGQVVFQTTNRKQGWDGMFKGTLQPMDVYTYTLDVVFTDGRKLRKTGDISLLR